ncbi:hypothetical protein LTS08_004699 [Lithohypha guttulata]|nr:hypothetical protein LTS08_004699 [Lithohypha guttulata]
MSSIGIIGQIDEAIGTFFAQWNTGSTIIVGLVLIVLIYPIFTARDPDTHPFLLARQAQASPIRQPGESAVYRSTEIPYGYPLKSGLGIKDPGASKWTTGRDGDLRDVWRQAVNGSNKEDGNSAGGTAKIATVLGVEKVVEHNLKDLTRETNIIGKHIKESGGRKVAVCLSNSTELLCTVLAGAFYDFSPILVPYHQEPGNAVEILKDVEFDTLVAEAGSVALETLLSQSKSIRRIIWVAKAGSKHLDWNEVPEGVGGKLEVNTWHDLIDEKKGGASDVVPPLDKENEPLPVYALQQNKSGQYDSVECSQRNLLSGTSALQSSLPRLHKLANNDSILITTPLNTTYALCWALLALFSGSTLLLTSVAGPNINLITATKSARQLLKPTQIIADARSIPRLLEDLTSLAGQGGLGAKYSVWSTARAINQGYMPSPTSKPTYLPSSLSALKTLYIAQPDILPSAQRISSATLSNLRLLLSARVSLALTSARVAGYIAQTNILDYRDKLGVNCVGPVAASLEVCLVGEEDELAKSDGVGEVAVKGPGVAGREKGRVVLEGVRARVDLDNTVVLVGSITLV